MWKKYNSFQVEKETRGITSPQMRHSTPEKKKRKKEKSYNLFMKHGM